MKKTLRNLPIRLPWLTITQWKCFWSVFPPKSHGHPVSAALPCGLTWQAPAQHAAVTTEVVANCCDAKSLSEGHYTSAVEPSKKLAGKWTKEFMRDQRGTWFKQQCAVHVFWTWLVNEYCGLDVWWIFYSLMGLKIQSTALVKRWRMQITKPESQLAQVFSTLRRISWSHKIFTKACTLGGLVAVIAKKCLDWVIGHQHILRRSLSYF